MNLGHWELEQTLTFTATTHNPSTLLAQDADDPPTYRVYEDENETPLLTGSMALFDAANTDGIYTEQIVLSAANGFEVGKTYFIVKTATVDSFTGNAVDVLQVLEASLKPLVAGRKLAVDANNRIEGIAGTLNTLDALDAEQDTQHVLTRTQLTVNTDDIQAAITPVAADALSSKTAAESTVAIHPTGGANMAGEGANAKNLDDLSATQPRVNKRALSAYRLRVSTMSDGTFKAIRADGGGPVRLRPGAVDGIAIEIDMRPIGGETFVKTVGAPTVSAGSITAAALGPRDTAAMIELDGTATASESRTVSVLVTLETDEVILVTFDVVVFAS